jgi:hypothetical protein
MNRIACLPFANSRLSVSLPVALNRCHVSITGKPRNSVGHHFEESDSEEISLDGEDINSNLNDEWDELPKRGFTLLWLLLTLLFSGLIAIFGAWYTVGDRGLSVIGEYFVPLVIGGVAFKLALQRRIEPGTFGKAFWVAVVFCVAWGQTSKVFWGFDVVIQNDTGRTVKIEKDEKQWFTAKDGENSKLPLAKGRYSLTVKDEDGKKIKVIDILLEGKLTRVYALTISREGRLYKVTWQRDALILH